MSKIKTYTLYLAKAECTAFDEIFTETARAKVRAANVKIYSGKISDSECQVYIFNNPLITPGWLIDLQTAITGIPDITNKTACALLVFKRAQRIFVCPFAHGWQFIDDAKIESEFGLRVAINSLNDTKINRVDRNNLGEAMKGSAQSAFQRDIESFGVDEALDLIRRITGRIEDDDFANTLAGSTSLKISREMTLSELPAIAEEALQRFGMRKYTKTKFYIIDKIKPIRDKPLILTLDNEAVSLIKNKKDNFELSMPGWSSDDIVYYGLYGPGVRGRHPDLLMRNYIEALGKNIDDIDVDTICNKHGVIAEFNNDTTPSVRFSIKKSLVGSIVYSGGLYAISEGEWYRVDQTFKSDVDKILLGIIKKWDNPPLTIIKKLSKDGKKSGFESELEYNTRCAKAYNQICLDQKIITVPEIPYGKFEACDLLDIKNKKLIHVKKSSRQSSFLSHFFKQGSNSARILKTIPESRNVLVDTVEKISNSSTSNLLKKNLGKSLEGWTVEFHIIDAPRKNLRNTIPFFSRVTLREEIRLLKGMEFDVALRFITTK